MAAAVGLEASVPIWFLQSCRPKVTLDTKVDFALC